MLRQTAAKWLQQIIDHMADVGFTGTVLEKKHCKYIPFYKDELVIITPNTERYQKLLEDESRDDISWMQEEHVIMREEGSGTQQRKQRSSFEDAGQIKMTDLDIIASIENQETIKKSVRQGMGISVLSKLATEDEVAAWRFSLHSLSRRADDGRDINLVYNKNYQLSRSAERFVKIVK